MPNHRLTSLLSVALLQIVTSCGSSAAPLSVRSTPSPSPSPSVAQHGSLTVAGLKRTYRLYVPSSLDTKQKYPIVIVLTGCPGTGDEMADLTHADEIARAGGFVVAYPDPVPDATGDPANLEGCWDAGTCCGDAQSKGVDDVKFISSLLDHLITQAPVDKTRVFVAGLSAGGMMAYRLGCELSSRLVAIASVSGAQVIKACRPPRPISILEMHGTNDSRLPYDGDQYFPSTTSTIQRWVSLDGCAPAPAQAANGISNTSTWSQCREGTVVRFDTITGGHHSWFGSDMDPVPGEPSANAVVWEFFKNLAPRP